jgi:hypothetical protein
VGLTKGARRVHARTSCPARQDRAGSPSPRGSAPIATPRPQTPRRRPPEPSLGPVPLPKKPLRQTRHSPAPEAFVLAATRITIPEEEVPGLLAAPRHGVRRCSSCRRGASFSTLAAAFPAHPSRGWRGARWSWGSPHPWAPGPQGLLRRPCVPQVLSPSGRGPPARASERPRASASAGARGRGEWGAGGGEEDVLRRRVAHALIRRPAGRAVRLGAPLFSASRPPVTL